MPLLNGVSDHDIIEAGRREAPDTLNHASDSILSGVRSSFGQWTWPPRRTGLEPTSTAQRRWRKTARCASLLYLDAQCTDPQVEMASKCGTMDRPRINDSRVVEIRGGACRRIALQEINLDSDPSRSATQKRYLAQVHVRMGLVACHYCFLLARLHDRTSPTREDGRNHRRRSLPAAVVHSRA